jgi:hypothetical protein
MDLGVFWGRDDRRVLIDDIPTCEELIDRIMG